MSGGVGVPGVSQKPISCESESIVYAASIEPEFQMRAENIRLLGVRSAAISQTTSRKHGLVLLATRVSLHSGNLATSPTGTRPLVTSLRPKDIF